MRYVFRDCRARWFRLCLSFLLSLDLRFLRRFHTACRCPTARIIYALGWEAGYKIAVCYTLCMYNWSVDTTRLKKNPQKYAIFKLEQAVNFGLNGKKLSAKLLKQHWNNLRLDPFRKNYLARLLWPKQF